MIEAKTTALSRRNFCLCCAASLTTAYVSPRQAFAQAKNIVNSLKESAGLADIATHRLRNNVALLEGSGGNIAVYCGRDGKVLVDAGISASRPRLSQALAALGDQPIATLINTHWHFDHTDGNEWLHSEGATIIAHQNTTRHLHSAQRVDDWDFNFPPSPQGAIPATSITNDTALDLAGAKVKLACYAPAHTDSDISVHLEEANVLHVADIYWNGLYPFIDYSTGGSIDGTIAATEKTIGMVGADTIIVPGHGQPVSNLVELKQYREMLVTIRENVAKLKAQGKSAEEVVDARPTAAFDDRWGKAIISPAFFTKLVYKGV